MVKLSVLAKRIQSLIFVQTWLLLSCKLERTLVVEFHMTVESHYAVAFATLCDWLKNITQVFQPMRSKIKTNSTLFARCFRALRKLQVTGRNSDWFIITLYTLVVIAWSNNLSIGFSIVIRKVLYGE